MRMNIWYSLITICLLLLISCSNNAETAKETDYETTKKMIVDILQTEDGKKALSEVLNDDAMKQRLVIDSDTVKDALKEQFISEQGSEMRSEEHTSELQSRGHLVCRLLLEKKKNNKNKHEKKE